MTEHNRPEKTKLSKTTYQRKQRISDLTISLEHSLFITHGPIRNVSVISKCVIFKNNQYPARSIDIHDDVIKYENFPHYWPFVRGIHWSPVNSHRPGTRSFGVFFDLLLNKRLSKQSRRRWSETPSRSSWRNCKYQPDITLVNTIIYLLGRDLIDFKPYY